MLKADKDGVVVGTSTNQKSLTVNGTTTSKGLLTAEDGLTVQDGGATLLTVDTTNGVKVANGKALNVGDSGTGDATFSINGTGNITSIDNTPESAVGLKDNQVLATMASVNQATSTATKYVKVNSTGDNAASATGTDAIAIGRNTQAAGANSVALGQGSKTLATDGNAVSVGDSESDLYRKIINVANGTSAHDVATIGQVNTNNNTVMGAIYNVADNQTVTYDKTALSDNLFKKYNNTSMVGEDNLTGSLNRLATNVKAATGSAISDTGHVENDYLTGVTAVDYTALTDNSEIALASAIGQINKNVGTAITGTTRDKAGATTAADSTVNQNIEALDTAIGAFEHYTEAQKADFIAARAYKEQRATYVSRKTALETEKAAYPTTHEGMTWDDMEAIIRGKSESERTDAQKALLSKIDELADVTTKLAEGGAYYNENYISPTTGQPVGEEQILYTLKKDADVTQNLVYLDNRLGDFASIPVENAYVSKDKSVAENLMSLDDAIGTWGGVETSGKYIGKSKNFEGGISVGQALTALDNALGSNEGVTGLYTIKNTPFGTVDEEEVMHTVASDLAALDEVIGDKNSLTGTYLDKTKTLTQNMKLLNNAIEAGGGGGGGGDIAVLTERVNDIEYNIIGSWPTTTEADYYYDSIAGRLTHAQISTSLMSLDKGVAKNTYELGKVQSTVGAAVVGTKDPDGNISSANYIYGKEIQPGGDEKVEPITANLRHLDKAIGKVTQDGTVIKATHNATGKPDESVSVASNLVLLDSAVATKINETQAKALIKADAVNGTYDESVDYVTGTIGAAIKAASSGASAEALVGTIKQDDGVTTLTVADALGVNSDSHKLIFTDTYGNLAKHEGATTTEPKSVVEAFANLDTNIGKIHGLVTQTADGYMYNATDPNERGEKPWTNLAVGTTVEEDLLALNKSVGNRNQLVTGTNYTNPTGASNLSVADAVKNLDTGVKAALDLKADEADLANYAQIDGGNYASTTGLYDKIESQITGKGYITKDVSDLTNYTTTADLQDDSKDLQIAAANIKTTDDLQFASATEKAGWNDKYSKDLQIAAANIKTTDDLQFASATEKAGWNDKYTKAEVDAFKVSKWANDAGYITKDVSDLTNYTKTSDLAPVALSGKFADLVEKPTTLAGYGITDAQGKIDANHKLNGAFIQNATITKTQLANGAVEKEQLADNAVTSEKIKDGAITNADISADANIASSKIRFNAAQDAALGSGINSTKVAQITKNANDIDNLETWQTGASIDIANLKTTVGGAASGLVKDMADAKNAITSQGTRLTSAEGKISSLETTVGNSSSGLVKDVADIKSAGYQTADQVEDKITSKGYTTMDAVEAKGYATTTEVNAGLNGKQDKITTSNKLAANLVEGLSEVATGGNLAMDKVTGLDAALSGKQDTISDLATIRSGAAAGATSIQGVRVNGVAQTVNSAHEVLLTADTTATQNSTNLITSGAVYEGLSLKANTADLAAVATTGKYSDLIGAPTDVSSFTNDAGYITKSASDLDNYYTKTNLSTAGGAVVHGSNLTDGSVSQAKLDTTLSDKIDSFITKDVSDLTYYTTTADLQDDSKDLQIAAANIKVTDDLQFASATEKAGWNDKYKKSEVDAFKVSKWDTTRKLS